MNLIFWPITFWHELWHFIPALLLGYRPTMKHDHTIVNPPNRRVGLSDYIVILTPSFAGMGVTYWLLNQAASTHGEILLWAACGSFVILQSQCLFDWKDALFLAAHGHWPGKQGAWLKAQRKR